MFKYLAIFGVAYAVGTQMNKKDATPARAPITRPPAGTVPVNTAPIKDVPETAIEGIGCNCNKPILADL